GVSQASPALLMMNPFASRMVNGDSLPRRVPYKYVSTHAGAMRRAGTRVTARVAVRERPARRNRLTETSDLRHNGSAEDNPAGALCRGVASPNGRRRPVRGDFRPNGS